LNSAKFLQKKQPVVTPPEAPSSEPADAQPVEIPVEIKEP
jgi:hypothetical protein